MPENDQLEINAKREKVNKTLVYVGIISSIMLFAGFSSAVLVRKMDKFWVNIHLPNEFIISTILIILSSLTLYLSLRFAKKDKVKQLKAFIIITLILGLGFCYYQFKGWQAYYNNGNAPKSYIMNTVGMYGKSFRVLKSGDPIIYNGHNYLLNGKELTSREVNELKNFTHQFCGEDRSMNPKPYNVINYHSPYSIVSVTDSIVLEFNDGIPSKNGVKLSPSERDDLFKFAFGVYNNFPFFMIDGQYGKDFSVYLNGKELVYHLKKFYLPERQLTEDERKKIKFPDKAELAENEKQFTVFIDGNPEIIKLDKQSNWVVDKKELNSAQYNELFQTQHISSSFVIALTGIHFLHFIVGWIVLLVVFFRAIKGKYHSNNQVGLKAGSVFWHFVGVLWIYLYVFLEYIN